ncbi:MAG: DoxX-like family protein [Limnohabitans sp.]|nr:DoxX-like family protein [Limnohabitans sp.]
MNQIIEKTSRLGVFGTFLGHGIVAVTVNPKWIPLLTYVGLTELQAIQIMPFIGYLDIIVAVLILFYPNRYIINWAIFWAFLTAIIRPISGQSILEFIERSANWVLPIILMITIKSPSPKKKVR